MMRSPSYKIGIYGNARELQKAVKEWSAEGYRIEHLNTAIAAGASTYSKVEVTTTYTLAMVRWPDLISELCGEQDPMRNLTCVKLLGHSSPHNSHEAVRSWDKGPR